MSTTTPNSPLLDTTRSRNKSTLHFAGFIVAAHLAVFLGLLLIGCNKENKNDGAANNPSGSDPAVSGNPAGGAGLGSLPGNLDTNFPAASNGLPALAGTNAIPIPAPAPLTSAPPAYVPPPVPQPAQPEPIAATGGQGYKVKGGDIAYKIAKAHNVSLKALGDANPGVNLAKLKVGQEIQIPGASAAAAPAVHDPGPIGAVPDAGTGETSEYVVKGGDNLSKIAKHYHTSVKAIRQANHLSSDAIKQGQKLKIPAKAADAGSHAAPPTETPAAIPAPGPAAVPSIPGPGSR